MDEQAQEDILQDTKENNQKFYTTPPLRIEQLLHKCMDSLGYVMFVGIITNKRDELGNNIIDWDYRRVQFNLKDVYKGVEEFYQFYRADNSKNQEENNDNAIAGS